MATTTYTPSMLRGAGTRGIPEIPAGSSFADIYSLNFDGIDDSVTVSSFTTSGNDLTVSIWLKAVNLGSGDPNGAFVYGDANNFIYYNLNEVIYAKVNGHTSILVANSGGVPQIFGTGNWHHLAITKTGSTLTWWVDGASFADLGTSGAGGFTMDSIGADVGGTVYYLDGNLDDLAIWDSDQSSNISTIYNGGTPGNLSSLSPLGWWQFEEGSGTTAIDSAGSNNGTINGATYSTDVPT